MYMGVFCQHVVTNCIYLKERGCVRGTSMIPFFRRGSASIVLLLIIEL